VATEGVADHSADVAPVGTVAAVVQLEAAVVDHTVRVTLPAMVVAEAGPKLRVTAPDCVLVVVVVFVTVTLPVVVSVSLPKVYAAELKLLVLNVSVAALSVLETVSVAVQYA
jgi:hypothetical protein